ncbi:MAG: SDR family NAD(P)-dependent oxidoreductase [Calditrichia bacterium]|jgi:NAD dependent epimerase/dehydratase|nr:SDR family NAD(P)-dependent oxidoreductase [Calditrichia bacterium]
MKRALVTGAGGFIGSHLVAELVRKNYDVIAFLHYSSRSSFDNLDFFSKDILDKIHIVRGNIEDKTSIKKAINGVDTVFNLAALISIPYSYVAPESYVKTNILGTLNILQTCLEEQVSKVIHTSTSETYGTAIYTPIDEKHPLQGQSPYSASKIGADKIVESFFKSYDLPAAIIRPFNTYGPGQSARAIIPTIITQALTTTDKKIELGLLSPIRDLTYVEDTVNGFIKIAENDDTVGKVINIGAGVGISIGDLAKKIIGLIDPKIEISYDEERERPPKSEVMELTCDNTLARELLDWNPQYTIDAGLKKTIAFIKDNLSFYKPEKYSI